MVLIVCFPYNFDTKIHRWRSFVKSGETLFVSVERPQIASLAVLIPITFRGGFDKETAPTNVRAV